ncbi:hypothetical protein AB0C21_27315 [Spirillospora sp. NPDC049024]
MRKKRPRGAGASSHAGHGAPARDDHPNTDAPPLISAGDSPEEQEALVTRRRAAMPPAHTTADPSGAGAPVGEPLADPDPIGERLAEALKDYRLALDAYDRAKTAASEPDALSALKEGRAALIRLDARRNGRPVPIDALEPRALARRPHRAEASTGERFAATGRGNGPSKSSSTGRSPDGRRSSTSSFPAAAISRSAVTSAPRPGSRRSTNLGCSGSATTEDGCSCPSIALT